GVSIAKIGAEMNKKIGLGVLGPILFNNSNI
ncbi:MAG: hypothetical protein ACI9CF_000662, partial [Candidatus Omnitrophota bacterium]